MKRIYLLMTLGLMSKGFGQETTRSLSGESWKFKNAKEANWLSASVPGTVHTDLMANNKIPDPYLDENEKKVQWVETEDWDYQTTFKVSDAELKNDQAELIFDGLDTFAEIYLNGKPLQQTNNMFRQWIIPVKNILVKGDNVLQIKFKSSVNVGNKMAEKVPFKLPESPRSMVRKAQYQFGWDWGPRLVTAGIWKDVKLNFWNNAKISNIQLEQKSLTTTKGQLSFNIEVVADKSGNYQVAVNNLAPKAFILQKGVNKISVPYEVKNPKLWQPNGWGKPELYDFKVTLTQQSKKLDEESLRHGFRTVKLVQEKDTKGKSFYFLVNGKPLYAKGTNWIPSDSFLPRITKQKYYKLIQDAKDANMNMIRIWGGGAYEDEAFYKACDENGILVWQDFMFAGSFYPSDNVFVENVKEEVKYQVRRLQNHPSIALWCGNNEVDEAIVNWGYQKQFKYTKEDSLQVWKDYRKVFHEAIPQTLKETLTPDNNIYWPSSPSIGWGHKESLTEGDSHYWGVWWGEQPFEMYEEKVPRFASEYGVQGMPSMEAVKSMFSGKADLNLQNPVIKAHEKHARGWQIIDGYMTRYYTLQTDLVQYNYLSQLLQARAMQVAIEAHRRAMPYNMGSLYWQINDCWPVVSWSSIDYLGNWKAAHYQAKRSFEQQLIAVENKDGVLKTRVINDGLKDFKSVRLSVSIQKLNGEVVEKFDETDQKLNANSIVEYSPLKIADIVAKELQDQVVMHYTLKDEKNNVLAESNFYLVYPKDLKLTKPNLLVKKISATEIEVSTDVLAKDVYLIGDTHFSDNFFDLMPNTKKRINLSKPLEKMDIMSLWDTKK
ncbi:beta-mannosidase [Elizabethkingia anophelis]|uniref:beta-mannosidase n=1 Tax=Elizabethkingia anophelis TaxID=1117645 RepID=UPI00077E489D|nr:glycoside hydrolase family 2 protein [Elizabethkingia anophelis]AMR40002.1 beta-mannosidase [Elizabethkingia anophelis]AMX46638.1 beta-mannosidase [Elizabethkingia anophelis]AMX50099.1 beta-mannosidase [Elizabethkingia anophelis]AMX53489.1 beta-mannosidase [Elizabethkingia anophelis]OPB82349.1 beta-mannosidase [Elizabethkingia anophelis]